MFTDTLVFCDTAGSKVEEIFGPAEQNFVWLTEQLQMVQSEPSFGTGRFVCTCMCSLHAVPFQMFNPGAQMGRVAEPK